MKYLGPLILFFFCLSLHAQNKEYKKLDELFNNKQFEKCIEQALKYNSKDPKELLPILFCAKANYELFKLADDKKKKHYINQSLKYTSRISKLDKENELEETYRDFMAELHKSTVEYAHNIFSGENKGDSKTIYENLAKIYGDTTLQFYEFHPELAKKTISSVGVNSKTEEVNKIDRNGLKQGFWRKVYPNGSVAYEVYFKDNKPTGVHKRYHENGKLMAILKFDDNGKWADAELFDESEKLIAKGKYQNKLKQGLWLFIKDSIKLAEVNYVKDKRNGISKTFYENGTISEEKTWENDVENGVWRQYFQTGKVKLETRVDNGVRNSVYLTYHPNGQLETRGQYKEDHMNGDWIFYDDRGKEVYRLNYKMGKTDQQHKLDEKETEMLNKMEQNKYRLKDPANYINNPNEYLKESGMK